MTSSVKFQIGIIETEGIAENKVKKEEKNILLKRRTNGFFCFSWRNLKFMETSKIGQLCCLKDHET